LDGRQSSFWQRCSYRSIS